MKEEEARIYVAGNPDLYPLEYYDPESQTYQGAIPTFLQRFAQEYGYDLCYYQPGAEDRRDGWAENRQVDLISGCTENSFYNHTEGEPLVLFSTLTEGEEIAYLLYFTDVAPSQFQADLREYAARSSQAEWTGALLKAVETQPAQQSFPLALVISLGMVAALLLSVLLVSIRRFRRSRRRWEQARTIDAETGLYTLAYLEDAIARLVSDQTRILYYLVYFHLDLDHLGHLGGPEQAEAFFRHAVETLRQEAVPGDILVRGAEGALIVLRESPREENVEEWVRTALAGIRKFSFAGGVLRQCDAVAGIYPMRTAYCSLDQMVFHARQCALVACREEMDCRICGTEQYSSCLERWRLLEEFEQGIAQGEFQLYLQFFVDARTFQVMGGEALSRWNHPQRKFLTPDSYIPLLEKEERISRLDFYGLEQTCGFLEDLDRHQIRNFFISCNFSRKTFSSADFAERCAQVLERYHFTRHLLIFEVTENGQLNYAEGEQMLQNIVAVRSLGVRVIFDDFGMGFSSFHDLQEYPMDGLKLDKQLVDNMWTEQGRIILNALVETGHRMGLTILAEGVEDDDQISTLQELNCDVLQGFRFFIPLPAEEAKARILERIQE